MTGERGGRFAAAIAAFDAIHRDDPRLVRPGGEARPRELVYAERMSHWLARLHPDAPEALRLAARCQHLRRWAIRRPSYPEGREGYLAWRAAGQRAHAELAGHILAECGYEPALIARVQALIQKRGLKRDAEAQALEDAACLAFFETDLEALAVRHERPKLEEILAKVAAKMSAPARKLLGEAQVPAGLRELIAPLVGAPPGGAQGRPSGGGVR